MNIARSEEHQIITGIQRESAWFTFICQRQRELWQCAKKPHTATTWTWQTTKSPSAWSPPLFLLFKISTNEYGFQITLFWWPNTAINLGTSYHPSAPIYLVKRDSSPGESKKKTELWLALPHTQLGNLWWPFTKLRCWLATIFRKVTSRETGRSLKIKFSESANDDTKKKPAANPLYTPNPKFEMQSRERVCFWQCSVLDLGSPFLLPGSSPLPLVPLCLRWQGEQGKDSRGLPLRGEITAKRHGGDTVTQATHNHPPPPTLVPLWYGHYFLPRNRGESGRWLLVRGNTKYIQSSSHHWQRFLPTFAIVRPLLRVAFIKRETILYI